MLALEHIAENKIAEAIARGELENLPGEGKPLDLGDDPLLPQELRMAWRILKNAGYMEREPPSQEKHERAKAVRKLELLQVKLEPRYYGKVLKKLSR